jgi:hypothetical protein
MRLPTPNSMDNSMKTAPRSPLAATLAGTLRATAVIAAVAIALTGCAKGGGTSQAAPASPRSAGQEGNCNADYCAPADWDTATAATPLKQIPSFAEPLNVIISARSTVSLAQIQRALDNWKTVSTATTVSVTGIHIKCISSENADVTGGGYLPQHVAWRLGGCLGGNELSLSGNEDHVRIWNQPAAGSENGAWFAAASYETMCVVRNGTLQTASANKGYAAVHSASAYHCVDGGPGSIATRHPDGYDDAARDFAAAILAAAKSQGWHASERTVTVARRASSGEGGVPFNDTVYVLTIAR